ncbi:hypothetical protein PALB_6340 [Pseudoalteromonas luteoviolacea B = ATCC 29581]|nr:hypothetical protein PALB_6340 [Pseudoalteromonas luteoviolacea B = ATCC 29581]
MQYSYHYTLDKPFYRECFEQCAPFSPASKPKYFLLIGLIALGMFAIYGLQNNYLGNFMILLAVLECVSYYFKAAWWVQRQWWSRSGGTNVLVTINEQGISTENRGVVMKWLWADFSNAHLSELGVVLVSQQGNHYLSRSTMPEHAFEFIRHKVKK